MSGRIVLTLDLGTSATKAALWADADVVAIGRAPLTTTHPAPDRAEQDPESWWTAVVDACAAVRAAHPEQFARIDTVACSAARETFALVDDHLAPIGPGILWSDHRAEGEVATLGDPDGFRRATGVVASAGCAAAKVAWVARRDPSRFAAARWVLAPRDLVVARLTGTVATDPTLAARTGWVTLDGTPRAGADLAARLPPLAAATELLPLRPSPWVDATGLPPGTRVVRGAGDRACEALGAGARPAVPMVSWGTTANVSVPHPGPVAALPIVAQVSRAPGDDGFLVEAGLAAAGSALAWLAGVTGRAVAELWESAGTVPPGSHGLLAFPWFAGARAPHWRAGATAGFAGLRPHHSVAELARALVEGVALDVARSIALLGDTGTELVVTGGGAVEPTWRAVLGGVTGRRVVVRRHAEAASVGARLLAARATGESLPLDAVNPVRHRIAPDPSAVTAYQEVRAASDRAASALLAPVPAD